MQTIVGNKATKADFIKSADVKPCATVNLMYQWTTKTVKNMKVCETVQQIKRVWHINKALLVGVYLQGSVQVSLIRRCSCCPDDFEEEDVAIGTSRVWSDRSINKTVVTQLRMIRHL